MTIEAVTFDATGTLFHCPSLAALYSESLGRHGIEMSQAEVERWFPVAWKESDCRVSLGGDRFADHPQGEKGFWEDLVGRLCQLGGQEKPGPFATAELFQVFARGSSWRLFPEVEEVLETLADSGLAMAVISNWDGRLVSLLEDLQLAGRFETIVTSSAVGHAKPDPRIFEAAATALQLPPEKILHVGDHRLQDFEGAAAVGFEAFLIQRDCGDDLLAAASKALALRAEKPLLAPP